MMVPFQLLILIIVYLHPKISSAIQSHSYWCHNQSAVLYIQREQIRRARISVFGERHHGFLSQSENLNFYKHINSNYTVQLFRNAHGYYNLIYRRLFKNANDHIRTLLYNYEHRLCKGHNNHHGNKTTTNQPLKCIPKCDFSCPTATSYLYRTMNKLSALLFLSVEEKNFSFTFVREPLARFISGMTEIEYRVVKNPWRQKYFDFKNELGSYQRFREFVEFLLLYGDSKTFFDEHLNVEIAHIAPMVGTILSDPAIHLYRMENFDNELRRLAMDVGQPDLYDLHVFFGKKNLAPHNSSRDEFNISLSSKSFLAHASPAARSYFFPSSSSSSSSSSSGECFTTNTATTTTTTTTTTTGNSSSTSSSTPASSSISSEPLPIPPGEDPVEYQQQAATYLVALCRIFLTDFICAGDYDLPQDCAFLRGEAFAKSAVVNPSQCSDGRNDNDDPLCGLNVEQEVVEGRTPSEICDGQICWDIYV